MKCRKKHDMNNPKKVVKSGRTFMSGTCPKTGTKMFMIVGKDK